ncbi:hypothetical protein ACLB9X_10650 [Streptomyces sp. 5K101]
MATTVHVSPSTAALPLPALYGAGAGLLAGPAYSCIAQVTGKRTTGSSRR